jgi:hypothetical protein
MSRFTKILTVSPLGDGKTWYLREEFGYDIGSEGSGHSIEVPAGFLTDFASVPRPLWWLFPTWGRYGNAAVIHDFCYSQHCVTRRRADQVFLEGMIVLGVGRFTRTMLFTAVRLFGGPSWWSSGRRKARGLTKVSSRPPLRAVETGRQLMMESKRDGPSERADG